MRPSLALEQRRTEIHNDDVAAGGVHTLHLFFDVHGDGQAAARVPFPVVFLEQPVVAGTGSLPTGAIWTPDALPTWNIGVVEWDIDAAGNYVGATFAVTVTNTTVGGLTEVITSTMSVLVIGRALRASGV